MAVVYRGDGAWGIGEGSPLTAAEVDQNFWDNVLRLVALETAVPPIDTITSIQLIGSQLTIFTDAGGEFGPFTVPIATFHWTGDWVADHLYSELELFLYQNDIFSSVTVYMVLRDHTSELAFDPNLLDGGEPVYEQLFQGPSISRQEFSFHVTGTPTANAVLFRMVALQNFFLSTTSEFTPNVRVWSVTPPVAVATYTLWRTNDSTHERTFIGSITVQPTGAAEMVIENDVEQIFSNYLLTVEAPANPEGVHADFDMTFGVTMGL